LTPFRPDGAVHHDVLVEINLTGDREKTRKPFAKRWRIKPDPEHGTLYRYVHGRCRCDLCKAASTAARKLQRQRQEGSAS
jgi:hypothetical protein